MVKHISLVHEIKTNDAITTGWIQWGCEKRKKLAHKETDACTWIYRQASRVVKAEIFMNKQISRWADSEFARIVWNAEWIRKQNPDYADTRLSLLARSLESMNEF